MKIAFLFGTLAFSSLTFAQDNLGTKPDVTLAPVTASPGTPGVMAFMQTLLVLGLVLVLLKVLIPKAIAKMGGRLTSGVGSSIRVEESASFAGGALYVVEARGRTLLVGVNTGGINCLADLTPPPKPDLPTFGEILTDQLETPESPPREVLDALARLDTLTR